MRMLLRAELSIEGSADETQSYVKGQDWPVGVIPVPSIGDTVSLVPGLNRADTGATLEVIERTFFPEGLLVKENSLGVIHVLLELGGSELKDEAKIRSELERNGWSAAS